MPRLDSVVTDAPPPTGGTSPLNQLATPYTPDADLLVDILARFPESKRNSAEAKVIAQAFYVAALSSAKIRPVSLRHHTRRSSNSTS